MTATRIAVAIVSVAFGLALLFHFVTALIPVVLPTLRQLGREQTTYFVLHIAGFSLSGWQILVFEGIVFLLSVGLILFAVYAFVSASGKWID